MHHNLPKEKLVSLGIRLNKLGVVPSGYLYPALSVQAEMPPELLQALANKSRHENKSKEY